MHRNNKTTGTCTIKAEEQFVKTVSKIIMNMK